MSESIKTAFDAFWFLHDHPSAVPEKIDPDLPHIHDSAFIDNLYIMYVKVNPATNRIEEEGNTKVQVWLETGPVEWVPQISDYIATHDYELDCGGDTFDDALIALANRVQKEYGDYRKADA